MNVSEWPLHEFETCNECIFTKEYTMKASTASLKKKERLPRDWTPETEAMSILVSNAVGVTYSFSFFKDILCCTEIDFHIFFTVELCVLRVQKIILKGKISFYAY